MKSEAAFVFSLFFAFVVGGFDQEKAEEPPHWKSDVSLGVSLARGNARSTNFSFTFSAGGPVGKNLTWESKGLYLFGEMDGGFDEVFTKYHDTGESTAFAALKCGGGLVWKISETAEFDEKAELLPELSDLGRFFIRWEVNVIAALAKSGAIKVSFIDSYDRKPIPMGRPDQSPK